MESLDVEDAGFFQLDGARTRVLLLVDVDVAGVVDTDGHDIVLVAEDVVVGAVRGVVVKQVEQHTDVAGAEIGAR